MVIIVVLVMKNQMIKNKKKIDDKIPKNVADAPSMLPIKGDEKVK